MMNAINNNSHPEAEDHMKDGLNDRNVPHHPVMMSKVILIDEQMQ
jgi:hypothetical protein